MTCCIGLIAANAATNPPESPASPPNRTLANGDALPVPMVQAFPVYPKEMKKVRGKVVVDFIIEKDGSVQAATALEATSPQFAEAAVACVKKWKFKPGLRAGVPVRTHMQVPILFNP